MIWILNLLIILVIIEVIFFSNFKKKFLKLSYIQNYLSKISKIKN